MKLIVDASVLFTGLIGKGVTKDIIFSDLVTLYAPDHMFEEFEEHKSRVKELSGLSLKELNALFDKLKSRIVSVPREEFERFLRQANVLVLDKDDTAYIALSLAKNKMPIWSNDPHFRVQSVIKVFTTSELAKHIKSAGHSL
jgi:predicted nucleic acid-binding protein